MIDDDAVVGVTLAIGMDGVEVIDATRRAEGLQRIRETHPDAVIIDRRFPDGDGLDLVRRLREDPSTRELPVVVLTAAFDEGDRDEVEHAGADAYVGKPFEVDDLLSVVDGLIARGRSRAHTLVVPAVSTPVVDAPRPIDLHLNRNAPGRRTDQVHHLPHLPAPVAPTPDPTPVAAPLPSPAPVTAALADPGIPDRLLAATARLGDAPVEHDGEPAVERPATRTPLFEVPKPAGELHRYSVDMRDSAASDVPGSDAAAGRARKGAARTMASAAASAAPTITQPGNADDELRAANLRLVTMIDQLEAKLENAHAEIVRLRAEAKAAKRAAGADSGPRAHSEHAQDEPTIQRDGDSEPPVVRRTGRVRPLVAKTDADRGLAKPDT